MVLLEDFTFVDTKGMIWTAKAIPRLEIDGASIPQEFWSTIGGPFEGQYRNASVVHDAECTAPYKHDWRDVHYMFYVASRAGGVDEAKAKLMYAAVYHFGPRWAWNGNPPPERTLDSRDDLLRLSVMLVKNRDLTVDTISGLSTQQLQAAVPNIELEGARACFDKLLRLRALGASRTHPTYRGYFEALVAEQRQLHDDFQRSCPEFSTFE